MLSEENWRKIDPIKLYLTNRERNINDQELKESENRFDAYDIT